MRERPLLNGRGLSASLFLVEGALVRLSITGLIFAVLLILPASALAAGHYDIHDKDGDDWLTWGPVMKTAFVEGFKSGSDYVIQNNDALASFPLPDRYDVPKAEKVQKEFYSACKLPKPQKDVTFPADDVILLMSYTRSERKKAMVDLAVGDYSTERIVEGIDELYEHYENRDIKIQDAVYYARKEIDRVPGEDLSRILNYLRSGKEQSDWLVVYDEKGKMKKYITFP